MKRTVLFLALATNVYACQAASQVCGDFNDYAVQKVSFSGVSLQTGLIKLTTGMPYQVIVTDSTDLKVSATDISGNLGMVLDKFSKEAGFTYKQNKCLIEVTVPPPAPKVPTWTLKEGHTIGKEIQSWATDAGWKVVWNLSKDWSVPAQTTFTGDFKSAATEVIKTLAANGVLIRAQFYDGNKTMVVSGPGVAEQ